MNPQSQSPKPESRLWDAAFGWFLALFFLWNVGMGAFSPLLPKVMEGLHLSFATAGLLGTAFAITRFLVDIPAGILADRLGMSWLLHGAAALLLGGAALAAAAGSFEAMAIARGLTGIGSGLANIISVLYLMRRGAAVHRNRRANLYELAVVAGMAVSAEAAGAIATAWDWRTSFGLAAGMLGGVWLVGAFGVLPNVKDTLAEAPTGHCGWGAFERRHLARGHPGHLRGQLRPGVRLGRRHLDASPALRGQRAPTLAGRHRAGHGGGFLDRGVPALPGRLGRRRLG